MVVSDRVLGCEQVNYLMRQPRICLTVSAGPQFTVLFDLTLCHLLHDYYLTSYCAICLLFWYYLIFFYL